MKPAYLKMICLINAFTALTLCSAPASAEPADSDLENGIALVKKGEYNKGALLLRKYLANSPDHPDANYFLGMALNRTSPGKESESFLKRSLMADPENSALNYELGLHYFEKDIPAEAVDYFEQVIQLAPQSEHAHKAKEYLRKIEAVNQEKNWKITVYAGTQYDTNVILNGKDMPLSAGYSGKSDWSAIINLNGSYSPLKSAASEVSISYNLFQSIHMKLDSFDIRQNLFELSTAHSFTQALRLKGTYAFEYLQLADKQYDIAHSLSPSLSFKSTLGTTTMDYRYRNTSYQDSPQFTTNSDRNGDNNLFGFSHLFSLSNSVAAWTVYNHDIERTRKSEWDYRGDRVLVGARSVLPLDLLADISGEVYWKHYGGTDPMFQRTRQDTMYTASLSLIKAFSVIYSLSLSEVFTNNISNIAEFKYYRSITSLLFNARF